MEKLQLEDTFKTPSVNFDPSSGELALQGRVFPENPEEFFSVLFEWLRNYSERPAAHTRLTLFLAYFNSTSSEYIFRLCKAIEQLAENGNDCSICWEYEAEDEDMKQIGEDYAEILKLNFELKAIM